MEPTGKESIADNQQQQQQQQQEQEQPPVMLPSEEQQPDALEAESSDGDAGDGGAAGDDSDASDDSDLVNRRARNDSETSDTSDTSDISVPSTHYSGDETSDGAHSDPGPIMMYSMSDDDEIVPHAERSMYTFRPYRLTRCLINERCNAIGGFPLRQGDHHLVASNSQLFALGSYYPCEHSYIEQQQLWRYSLATGRWQLLLSGQHNPNMANGMAIKSLLVHNNSQLLVFAGPEEPNVGDNYIESFVYRAGDAHVPPSAHLLEVRGELPQALCSAAFVLHQHYVYMIGGNWGVMSLCDVHRFDLRRKVWQLMYNSREDVRPEAPAGRFSLQLISDGERILCLGGGTFYYQVFDLKRILAFNLSSNLWEYVDTLPDLRMIMENEGFPKARKGFSCVRRQCSNGDIEAVICGGQESGFFTYIPDIWKLNLTTKQWTLILKTRLPQPTYFQSAALVNNDCMFILGGVDRKSIIYPIRNCTGLYKMWLTVPKLSELCWEAFTHYNDVGHSDRKALLSLGVPQIFVDRLPPQLTDRKDDDDDQPSTSSATKHPRLS